MEHYTELQALDQLMSRLRNNIKYNLVGQLGLIVLSVFSVKYIHNRLGNDVLGLIFFTTMINLLVSEMLQVGVAVTTVREVSSHLESDKRYISDYTRTSTLLYWCAYAVVSLGIILGAPWIVHHWITLDSLAPDTAIRVLQILGPASLLVLPRWLYVSLLRGVQRMGVINIIDVATTAVQHAGTIILIITGAGLFTVIYWYSTCFLVRIAIYVAVCLKQFEASMLLPGFRFYVIRRNMQYTSRLMVATVVGTVVQQLDKLIISRLFPIAAIGYYGFLFSGLSKLRILPAAIGQAAFPSLCSLYRSGEHVELREKYNTLQDLAVYSAMPLLAFAVYAAVPGLTFVFDKAVAQALLWPTIILCAAVYLCGALTLPYLFSLAVGNSGIQAKQSILDLIVYPLPALWLIWQFGMLGAACSVLFMYFLHAVYGLVRIYRECLKMDLSAFVKTQCLLLTAVMLTYGLAYIGIYLAGYPMNLPAIAGAYAIASLGYAGMGFLLLSRSSKDKLIGVLPPWAQPRSIE